MSPNPGSPAGERAAPPDRSPAVNIEASAPANGAYFPALDGLRTIAFLMVFGEHYLALPWGFTGVNVFFVLSGFLITGILVDGRDRPGRARNFYIRRTLRISPLYYAIFAVILLTTPLLHWQWDRKWALWPAYLGNLLRFLSPQAGLPASAWERAADAHLMTSVSPRLTLYLGHFWSLCVEEQFYLVWPWVVFSIRSRKALLWICGLTVCLVPLLRVAAAHFAPVWMLDLELLYRFSPFELDSLLLGGLLALLWRGAHRELLLRAGRYGTAVLLPAAALYIGWTLRHALALHGLPNSDGLFMLPYQYPAWRLTWGLTLANLLSAVVLLCALVPGHPVYRLLNLPPLRWMGRISYGLYIFHDITHAFWTSATYPIVRRVSMKLFPIMPEVCALMAFTATCLLAWLSFRFFESPILRLKERLAPRP